MKKQSEFQQMRGPFLNVSFSSEDFVFQTDQIVIKENCMEGRPCSTRFRIHGTPDHLAVSESGTAFILLAVRLFSLLFVCMNTG